MSYPSQQNNTTSYEGDICEMNNLNYAPYPEPHTITQEMYTNTQIGQMHKPNLGYNNIDSHSQFYKQQDIQNRFDGREIFQYPQQQAIYYQDQRNINDPTTPIYMESTQMPNQIENNLQRLNRPQQMQKQHLYSQQQTCETLSGPSSSEFDTYNQSNHTYQQHVNSHETDSYNHAYHPNTQKYRHNLTTNNASNIYKLPRQFMPAVGSNCTIETSSSSFNSAQNEMYIPEENFVHEEIITTSVPSSSQRKYSYIPLASSNEASSMYRPELKKAKLAMYGVEEEEDEDEESSPQRIQHRISNERMSLQNSPKLTSPTQKTVNPKNMVTENSNLQRKQSRKQQLPISSPKEITKVKESFSVQPKETKNESKKEHEILPKKNARKQQLPTFTKKAPVTTNLTKPKENYPKNISNQPKNSISTQPNNNQQNTNISIKPKKESIGNKEQGNFEMLKQPTMEVRKKPKAKISKPRSTGLEEINEAPPASVNSKRRPSAQLPQPDRKPVNKNVEVYNPLDKISMALEKQETTITPILPNKNAPSKRNFFFIFLYYLGSIMLSDNFMDALGSQTTVKKPKIVRKKLPSNSNAAIPNATTLGLFSDTSKNALKNLSNDNENNNADLPDGDTDGAIVPGRRRVRFADEHGAVLTEIRTFEIEEGERVNVTRMSSEDMKHFEMQREKTFIREQKNMNWAESQGSQNRFSRPLKNIVGLEFSKNSNGIKWRLYPVDDAQELVERGVNSESRIIELKRMNTVMEAFFDPNTYVSLKLFIFFRILPISEIDSADLPKKDEFYSPKIIPLETSNTSEESGGEIEILETIPVTVAVIPQTSTIIQQLPLPSIPNFSHISLPPTLAELVSKLPDIKMDSKKFELEDIKNIKSLSDDESPLSPTLSDDEKDVQKAIIKNENLEEVLSKKLTKQHMGDNEDLDLRSTDKNTKKEFKIEDEDLDFRAQPPLIPVDSIQKPIKTEPGMMSDVQALLKTLRESGTNLADILNKVQYTTATSATVTTTSTSSTKSTQPMATFMPQQPNINRPPFNQQSAIRPFPPSWSANQPPRFSPRYGAGIPRVGAGLLGTVGQHQSAQQNSLQFNGMGFSGLSDDKKIPPYYNSSNATSSNLQPNIEDEKTLQTTQQNMFRTDEQTSNKDRELPPGGSVNNISNSNIIGSGVSSSSAISSLPLDTNSQQHFGFSQQNNTGMARTFVKQCTYYMSGGCHYGETCRFAHGEEITMGVRQAMGAVRGRGGYRGNSGRPPPVRPGINSSVGPHVNPVGGGIEIDYDERENRIRTFQIPPSHIMITDPRMRLHGGRNRRYTSPLRKGYHDTRNERYGGKSAYKYGSRRRRSSSSSVSPSRKSRRSRSRSKTPPISSHRRGGIRRHDSRSPRRSSSRHHRKSSPENKRSSRRRSKSPSQSTKEKTTSTNVSVSRKRRSVSSSSSSSSSSTNSRSSSVSASKHSESRNGNDKDNNRDSTRKRDSESDIIKNFDEDESDSNKMKCRERDTDMDQQSSSTIHDTPASPTSEDTENT